jgi:hypothetical protein
LLISHGGSHLLDLIGNFAHAFFGGTEFPRSCGRYCQFAIS